MLKHLMIAATAVTFCTAPLMGNSFFKEENCVPSESCEEQEEQCPVNPCAEEVDETEEDVQQECPSCKNPKAFNWFCSDDEIELDDEAAVVTICDDDQGDDEDFLDEFSPEPESKRRVNPKHVCQV